MSAGSIASAGSATTLSGANPFAAMSTGDFIKVLMSELTRQDPLDPQDSGKLLEQFSSLRNIESNLQLQDKLTQLVLQNQLAAAGNLIGKMVAGLDDANTAATGLVTSVRVRDGQAMLELDTGQVVAMSRVQQITS